MVSQAQVSAPAPKLGDADIVKVENNSKTLFMAIDSLNRKFDRMTEFGDPMATYSDQNVKKVIAAMEAYNAALKPFNGNKDLIPISGKDDQQKLAAINRWLGKKDDAPLDPATVKIISDKAKTAFNVVNNYMLSIAAMDTVPAATVATTGAKVDSAATLAAALRAQQPAPVAPALAATVPTPVTAQKPAPTVELPQVSISASVPKPVAPAPVAAAPQLMTVAVTDPIRKSIDDLRFISEYASASKIQDAARKLLASLTKADTDATQAQTTLPVGSTKRAKAEKARTDANKAATKFVEANLNAAEAAQLKTVAAPFRQHPRYREVAQLSQDLDGIESQTSHDIKRLLPGIWLVGETQMGQMIDSLKAAASSLKAGKDADRMQLGYAIAVFDAEQKLYRRILTEFVATPTGVTLSLLSQSTMPGKEKLVAMLQANLNSVRTFLSKAEIAYPVMADLFNSASTDERAVKMLVDAWNYSQIPENQARLKQLNMGQDLTDAFSEAVKIMSDKTFNPYITPTYTYERRKAIAANYLGVTEVTDRQLIKVEKEIAQLFMNSAEYKYDDAFLAIYEISAKITKPMEGPVAETEQSLARLRALRGVIDQNYSEFVKTELTKGQVKDASVDKAREFLQNAISATKKSGLKEDDPLMKVADKLAKGTDKTPEAAIATYQAAASLIAIREAQLWITTPALQWGGYLPADSVAANDALTKATQTYLATFSGTVPFHPNLARTLAEDAILASAPPLLATTDAPATLITYGKYMTDENGAASAVQAELLHLNLMLKNMNAPDFIRPSVQRAMENAQVADVFASLDLRVGRSTPVDNQYGFPVMGKTPTRFGITRTKVDINIDKELVPHEDRFDRGGYLNNEVARQHNLAANQGAPSVLRGFNSNATSYGQMQLDANVALLAKAGDEGKRLAESEKARINDLRSKVIAITVNSMHMKADQLLLPQMVVSMQQAAGDFAPPSRTPTPKSMADAVNKNFIMVLDIRIAELEHRLGGATVLRDGKPIMISELANAKDDRTIANARAFLTVAKGIREKAGGFVSGREFQEAIAAAENGISLLSDENLGKIERPKTRVGTYVVLDQPARDLVQNTCTYTVLETHFRTADGRDLTQEQYDKEFGPHRLQYHWYAWDSFTRLNAKSQKVNVEYLYHPYYIGVDDSSQAGYAPKYVGEVMRGATVKMPDGTTVTGDFVVRARLTEYAPGNPQWEPVDKGKTLNSENVLFQLEAGTRSPMNNDIFRGTLAKVRSNAMEPFSTSTFNPIGLIHHQADVSVVVVPKPLNPEYAKPVSVVIPKPANK